MIEQVVKQASPLELFGLRNSGFLDHPKIQIPETGSPQGIYTCGPIRSDGIRHEGSGIEPFVDLLGPATPSGKRRIADLVAGVVTDARE